MEEDKNYINLIRGDLTKASQAHNGMPDSVGMMNIKTANQTILEASLLPTPRALWDSFWYEGELSCLFADSNVGKSILSVQIADRIARTDNVLYLDFELSEKQFQLRYTNEHGELYTFPDKLYRVSIDCNQLLDANFEEAIIGGIEQMAVQTDCKIFIIESKEFSSYPVVIAPAYQLADKALVDRWTDYVKKGGNLVLTCRTAQKDRHGRLPEAPFGSMINGLTGNEMEFYDLLLPEEPGKLRMDGKEYTWNTWGEILKPGKDSQVWATYTQEFYEGKPAVTTHKLGKGTVTYVGVDSTDGLLEKDILKKLYAQLNIPVMDLPYGVTLEYRNGMGIVLNYTDKPYKFVLPSGAKVLIGEPVIPTAGVLVFSITD